MSSLFDTCFGDEREILCAATALENLAREMKARARLPHGRSTQSLVPAVLNSLTTEDVPVDEDTSKWLRQVVTATPVATHFLARLNHNLPPIASSGEAIKVANRTGYKRQVGHVKVILKGDLFFKPGKKGRLALREVDCHVEMRVDQLGTQESEAALMRVAPKEMLLCEHNQLVVVASSLNQALTIASRRLEVDRKTHTGNIYTHFECNGRTLDEIRIECERQLDRASESKEEGPSRA